MDFVNHWLRKTAVFLEMIRFEHSIFALPFAYLGLVLAEGGWPSGELLLWVTVAMVSFRTMGMALNRLIDHEIDAKNPRTSGRKIRSIAFPIWQSSMGGLPTTVVTYTGFFLCVMHVT